MKRLAEKKLEKWLVSQRRKPLIIRGARQVGKTWLVENFLAQKFEHFVKIDLEKQTELHQAFEQDLEPKKILNSIEPFAGRIYPGKTLLFIDEIQACPRAITALRYFYEDMPELSVVAAGSMLEFAFGSISIPVGRVQYLHLMPMNLYEFALAMEQDVAAERLLQHPREHDEMTFDKLRALVQEYFFIGGMPEAIKSYRETGSMQEAYDVHRDLLISFRQDFTKYRPQMDPSSLEHVFFNAAQCIGEQIKYTRLNDQTSSVTNRKAFDQLCKAKLVHKVISADPSGLPLGGSIGKRFKACMLDIGLMQNLCGIDPKLAVSKSNLLALYQGKLAEQFVGQEFLSWGQEQIDHQLYYWSRAAKSSNAEVDYLMIKDGGIYPVEVKSGPVGKLKSLHLLLENYQNCHEGWVMYDGPYEELPSQKLKFWPIYSMGYLYS